MKKHLQVNVKKEQHSFQISCVYFQYFLLYVFLIGYLRLMSNQTFVQF